MQRQSGVRIEDLNVNEYETWCEVDGYIHSVTTLYKASTRC